MTSVDSFTTFLPPASGHSAPEVLVAASSSQLSGSTGSIGSAVSDS